MTAVAGFCPLCRHGVDAFMPAPGGRPRATCPRCRSLERHRFLAVLLDAFAPELAGAAAVLEVAPTPCVSRALRDAVGTRYVGTDFDPGADGRSVEVRADLCAMPFLDGAFDVIVCFHVLEHIPDDRAAMRELARLLSDRGIAFIQVPWRFDALTDEDPAAGPEERLARFQQADHVRIYGTDFEERLEEAGLQVERLTVPGLIPEPVAAAMSIRRSGPIWLATRAGAPSSGADGPHAVARRVRGALMAGWAHAETLLQLSGDGAAVARLVEELAVSREQAAHWEDAYRALRDRWPLRVASRLRDVMRRRG